MKTLLALVLGMAMLLFAATIYAEPDEICCTWVNMNYKSGGPPQKLIYHQDGTYHGYAKQDSKDAILSRTYSIIKKWKDSSGIIWYQIRWDGKLKESGYDLVKLSDNGSTLEYVTKKDECPKNINAQDPSYCKYSRKKP